MTWQDKAELVMRQDLSQEPALFGCDDHGMPFTDAGRYSRLFEMPVFATAAGNYNFYLCYPG